uniref:Uncharacterized protein n=1 Tax=Tetraselmis sp. GSL018 TaxID=582737 RepID=A0A061QYS3_9CHLO
MLLTRKRYRHFLEFLVSVSCANSERGRAQRFTARSSPFSASKRFTNRIHKTN